MYVYVGWVGGGGAPLGLTQHWHQPFLLIPKESVQIDKGNAQRVIQSYLGHTKQVSANMSTLSVVTSTKIAIAAKQETSNFYVSNINMINNVFNVKLQTPIYITVYGDSPSSNSSSHGFEHSSSKTSLILFLMNHCGSYLVIYILKYTSVGLG